LARATTVGAAETFGLELLEATDAFRAHRPPNCQAPEQRRREGVKGPFGARWNPSTIRGNAARGTGVLNNQLYVGRLVWNRLRYIKNPDTGRRVSRLNPPSEWITKDVPELRIVSDELWEATKRRQEAARRVLEASTSIVRARKPRYLFSGLTRCGVCGSGFVLKSRNRLSCFGANEKGICSNHLTIRRDESRRVSFTRCKRSCYAKTFSKSSARSSHAR
jgi:hypothetical protein